MSTTTQYIGERYVPIVADPVEWNANREYEHLTIVMHNGDSYISKQDVPKGAQITNTRYWLKTNDYNAQLNQAIGKANTAIQKADEALAKFPVSIANGGTGKTTATEAWAALGGGSIGKKNALSASDIPSGIDASKITGTLGVAHGGTGVTTAQAERNRLGLGNTTDALPVANGGTGSTNAAAARTALDAAQSGGAAGTLYAAEQEIETQKQVHFTSKQFEVTFDDTNVLLWQTLSIPLNGYTPIAIIGIEIKDRPSQRNRHVSIQYDLKMTLNQLYVGYYNDGDPDMGATNTILITVLYIKSDRYHYDIVV